MTRKDKVAVMIYRSLELYLRLYPKERARLNKLLWKAKKV